jgi:hypothetical protein
VTGRSKQGRKEEERKAEREDRKGKKDNLSMNQKKWK